MDLRSQIVMARLLDDAQVEIYRARQLVTLG